MGFLIVAIMAMFQVVAVLLGGLKVLFWTWLAEMVVVVIFLAMGHRPGAGFAYGFVVQFFLVACILATGSALLIAAIYFFAMRYQARRNTGTD